MSHRVELRVGQDKGRGEDEARKKAGQESRRVSTGLCHGNVIATITVLGGYTGEDRNAASDT